MLSNILFSDETVQLMQCIALSNGLYDIDVDCYPVCEFYTNYTSNYRTIKNVKRPPFSIDISATIRMAAT